MDSAKPPDKSGSSEVTEVTGSQTDGKRSKEEVGSDSLGKIENQEGESKVGSGDSKVVNQGSSEPEGSGNLKKVEQSWVSVAEDKKRLKKYEVEVSMKEGKHSVEIPDEILDNPTHLWEDFVVGKFLDLAPHIAKVHMVLNKIWKYGEDEAKVEVYPVSDMVMRFKIPNLKAREKVLRRGMWNILGVPMIVSKWTPKIEEEKQEAEAIPMWVHLEKVPLHMYSWEALSFITSTVGYPVKLHQETASCSNLEVTKVFVRVNVSKVLPKEITFGKGGSEFTVKYYYPWLPSRCNHCEKWGHTEIVCGQKSKGKAKTPIKGKEVRGGEGSFVKEKDVNVSQQEASSSGKEEIVVVSSEEVLIHKSVVKEVDDTEKQSGWLQVAQAKIWRSQSSSPHKDDEIVISASKYSILEKEDLEDGEIKDDENQLGVAEDVIDSSDIVEDSILDQQERSREKSTQKGMRKGQKPRAQDANPRGKRSSRRKN